LNSYNQKGAQPLSSFKNPVVNRIIFGLGILLQPFFLLAEGPSEVLPEQLFDFWLGKWELTWTDSEGNTQKGTNHIERVLGSKVIQENFLATEAGEMTGFEGKSWSVYNPQTQAWHQTWVDNQGSYLEFIGEFDGEKRMFVRRSTGPEGKPLIQRMVFYDITENSLRWDWERSLDGGKTWELAWRINYERAE